METRLRGWVEALCAPACAGRKAGSPEGAAARALIVDALRGLGLEPSVHAAPVGANVVARVGAGRRRLVLLGAHYDHLGGAFLGADDNAAAIALLLEVGRALVADPPAGGDVLLVAFDAEESPFFATEQMGSMAFTRAPAVPLEDIELMLALDLVGHAVGPETAPLAVRQTLLCMGAEKSAGTGVVVAAAAEGVDGVVVRQAAIDIIPPLSDYEPFRRAGVPFLFLTCGRWRHYHQETDTPEHLDYPKLAATTRFVERLLRAALERPGRPRFDEAARDHAGTIASLLGLLDALGTPRAATGAGLLRAVLGRLGADGRCTPSDWSTVLQLVALLEQGLA
jgi:hypothetical protein